VTDQPATDEPTTDEQDSPVEPADAVEDVAVAEEVEPVDEVAPPEQAPAVAAPANTSAAPTATAVLTHVVRSIVDDADAVQVDAVEGRNRLKLEVKVGPGDLGRVIGRRGRTAQSIRTVVRAAATRDGVEVDVDFVD
jgi:predicted RNA-binding protein YlqC (UPF0109 family)